MRGCRAPQASPPGTKLSPLAARRAKPVQNSPSNRPLQAHPVQNSPRSPEIALFGAFYPSRENFFTLGLQTDHAGRTFYRMQNHFRDKTLPAYGPHALNRYKTLPARPKAPISAHFPHAGRVLYRFHHQQAEQGEESHAPTPRLTPTTHTSPNSARNSIA